MSRRRWIGTGIGVLLALALGACRETGGKGSVSGGNGTGVSARESDFFSCSKASDCVVENQRDCCPCSAGGGQVAIRKRSVGDYRAARAARCTGDLLCPQVYLCDDAATATCVAGRCALGRAGAPPSNGGRQGPM